mmetsp:Transcript_38083/g.101495  ORF Transcript_38083/g.101495 Transcript_38083/m.101495 type:complete len:201 (-) Transcript_38083:509-1111(-)
MRSDLRLIKSPPGSSCVLLLLSLGKPAVERDRKLKPVSKETLFLEASLLEEGSELFELRMNPVAKFIKALGVLTEHMVPEWVPDWPTPTPLSDCLGTDTSDLDREGLLVSPSAFSIWCRCSAKCTSKFWWSFHVSSWCRMKSLAFSSKTACSLSNCRRKSLCTWSMSISDATIKEDSVSSSKTLTASRSLATVQHSPVIA